MCRYGSPYCPNSGKETMYIGLIAKNQFSKIWLNYSFTLIYKVCKGYLWRSEGVTDWSRNKAKIDDGLSIGEDCKVIITWTSRKGWMPGHLNCYLISSTLPIIAIIKKIMICLPDPVDTKCIINLLFEKSQTQLTKGRRGEICFFNWQMRWVASSSSSIILSSS